MTIPLLVWALKLSVYLYIYCLFVIGLKPSMKSSCTIGILNSNMYGIALMIIINIILDMHVHVHA